LKPSMCPYLLEARLDSGIICKAVLPIAVCFTIQIILSNQAYLFADVAFLQMLKESNVVAVYIFSVLFAVEQLKWQYVNVLLLIVCATWMTVKGELNFTMAALLLQGTSFFAESLKITLQGLLLSNAGSGKKMDSFSYLLIIMPWCFCMFAIFLFICTFALPADQTIMPVPTLQQTRRMWPLLLANAALAVLLNVVGTFFVKATSAVSYVLTGILKDVMIVVTGILYLGHQCSKLQAVGFTLQVTLVFVWSMMKTFPDEFQQGFVAGLQFVLFGKSSVDAKNPTYGTMQESSCKQGDKPLAETRSPSV